MGLMDGAVNGMVSRLIQAGFSPSEGFCLAQVAYIKEHKREASIPRTVLDRKAATEEINYTLRMLGTFPVGSEAHRQRIILWEKIFGRGSWHEPIDPEEIYGAPKRQHMDLTRASSQEIGAALDKAGATWSYDDDGDIRLRIRSGQQPWIDAVFYEFDAAKADFSIRGQFLEGHAVGQENGMTRWEVPLASGHTPTAIAQKVVTVYLMPRPGGINVQIHASIAPLDQPRPMHIKIRPGSTQVSRIEREFPAFVSTGDSKQLWLSTRMRGTRVDEAEFSDMVSTVAEAGLAMFDGPFTGWLFPRDV